MCIYIYIYIHTYIHTYVNICMLLHSCQIIVYHTISYLDAPLHEAGFHARNLRGEGSIIINSYYY